ncbi:MAG TPA: SxtJ family membrane protein [Gemmataceae bacterium]
MRWSDIRFDPPRRVLRQFAGIWTVFFGSLALWLGYLRGNEVLLWVFAGLAATVGPLGLVWPPVVRPLYAVCAVVAYPVGWVVSHALLALLFYGLFTPLGLSFRLIGRDPLALRRERAQESYWEPRPQPRGPESYLRQF